jgi:hypothetical protein
MNVTRNASVEKLGSLDRFVVAWQRFREGKTTLESRIILILHGPERPPPFNLAMTRFESRHFNQEGSIRLTVSRRPTVLQYGTSNALASRLRSWSGLRSSHSQTINTRHPCALRRLALSRSRSRLRCSFGIQNSGRVRGIFPLGQSCPCQKQPWTNTTVAWRLSAMSGVPGSAFWCNRNLSPNL